MELQSFETATMPQNSFQKLRILVVLKRQYKIVLKLHKNARFKTAFLSIFVTKIHNFCYNNPLFCIFETIFGGLIRYKGTPRNISILLPAFDGRQQQSAMRAITEILVNIHQ